MIFSNENKKKAPAKEPFQFSDFQNPGIFTLPVLRVQNGGSTRRPKNQAAMDRAEAGIYHNRTLWRLKKACKRSWKTGTAWTACPPAARCARADGPQEARRCRTAAREPALRPDSLSMSASAGSLWLPRSAGNN